MYFPCFDPSLACVYHLGIAWMNDMIPKVIKWILDRIFSFEGLKFEKFHKVNMLG